MTEPTTTAPTTDRLGYTLFAVFRRPALVVDGADTFSGRRSSIPLAKQVATFSELGVTLRGVYDVSGLRHDADVMFWLHGESPDPIQEAVRRIRASAEIAPLEPRWNAMGVHREAEFAKDHSPAFMRDLPPKQYLTVYPFVRSYEWYLLPEEERGAMLRDHGRLGREFPQVQANTVASFALGDYEWLLPMESDELIDLVDMMRRLRYTEARLHVREEVPFFTGRLITIDELAALDLS